MERLTKRNEDNSVSSSINCPDGCKYFTCSMEEGQLCYHECEADYMCKLAEYEDLEEQGCLFKFPIKVGDKVYRPVPKLYRTYTTLIVCKIIIEEDDIFFKDNYGLTWNLNTIGKTVFLTKEEAEQKLKELENKYV